MEAIQVLDKSFVPYLSHKEILSRIGEIAKEIDQNYPNSAPLLLGVLNGSYRFLADLSAALQSDCEVQFIKVKSYSGTESTGKMREVMGLDVDVAGRDVIVVEDIVDTGHTMEYLIGELKRANPKSIEIATLLYKPDAYKGNHKMTYCGFEIPNLFVVGYGLDYNENGRNLNDIYQIKS